MRRHTKSCTQYATIPPGCTMSNTPTDFIDRVQHMRIYTTACRVCGVPASGHERTGKPLYVTISRNGYFAVVCAEFVFIGKPENVPDRTFITVDTGCSSDVMFGFVTIAHFAGKTVVQVPLDGNIKRILIRKRTGLCKTHAIDATGPIVFLTQTCPNCGCWHGTSSTRARTPFPLRMASFASGRKIRSSDVFAFDTGAKGSTTITTFNANRICGDVVVLIPKCPVERSKAAASVISRLNDLIKPNHVYLSDRAATSIPPGNGEKTGPRRFKAIRPESVLCDVCLDARKRRQPRCRVCGKLFQEENVLGLFGIIATKECETCEKELESTSLGISDLIDRTNAQEDPPIDEYARCNICTCIYPTCKMLYGDAARRVCNANQNVYLCSTCIEPCTRCGCLSLSSLCQTCQTSQNERFPAVSDPRVNLRGSLITVEPN